MATFKIEAYKCEWCGRLFEKELQADCHGTECVYDPKARTCASCAYSHELIKQYDNKEPKATGSYCPRANKLFLYPCNKYCADYRKEPRFESYNKDNAEATE